MRPPLLFPPHFGRPAARLHAHRVSERAGGVAGAGCRASAVLPCARPFSDRLVLLAVASRRASASPSMSSSCSEMAGAIAARLFPRPSFTRTQRGAEHTRSRAAAWGRSHTSPLLQLEAALPPHPGPRVPLRGAGISMRLRTMTTSTSRFRARRSRIYMHEDIPSSSSSRSLSPTRSLPRSPLLARAHRVRPLSSLQLERAAAEEISLRRVHQPLDVRVARRLTRGRNPMSE